MLVGRFQPRGVAFELLDDREQIVRDGRRLRALGMGVNGEDRVAMRGRPDRAATGGDRASRAIRPRMNSRCRIRYIVMSMSLRLRAVCSRPATASPQASATRRSM